jgi:dienelactone hydrolase
VTIAVEEPLGPDSQPLQNAPAVIWMHGGASGGTPRNLAPWRGVTARACYLSVTVGHAWPDAAQAEADCKWMGLDYPDSCGLARQGRVKLLNLHRPHDLSAVLDHLLATRAGQIDPSRIAVAGHSAGAGAALMVAGAARSYGARIASFPDPRPRAFLAFSPQGPGSDGFFETVPGDPATSWDAVERPILIATGDGDSTCKTRYDCASGESPSNRSAAFDRLPASSGAPQKYRLYLQDVSAPHGRFGLGRALCASSRGAVPDADCDRVISWLSAAALAFLDGHLNDRPAALDCLREGRIAQATDGVIRWDAK